MFAAAQDTSPGSIHHVIAQRFERDLCISCRQWFEDPTRIPCPSACLITRILQRRMRSQQPKSLRVIGIIGNRSRQERDEFVVAGLIARLRDQRGQGGYTLA